MSSSRSAGSVSRLAAISRSCMTIRSKRSRISAVSPFPSDIALMSYVLRATFPSTSVGTRCLINEFHVASAHICGPPVACWRTSKKPSPTCRAVESRMRIRNSATGECGNTAVRDQVVQTYFLLRPLKTWCSQCRNETLRSEYTRSGLPIVPNGRFIPQCDRWLSWK
jgi:hypothetical protein